MWSSKARCDSHSKGVFALRYLVIGKAGGAGPVMQPQQVPQMLDRIIVPSLEMLAQWEREGRIHGAAFAGRRGHCMIVDAASNEELNGLLMGLPFWGLLEWEITPLTSYESAANGAREISRRLTSL